MWLLVYFYLELSLVDEEALVLAKALYEQGDREQKVQMAEQGLTLQG